MASRSAHERSHHNPRQCPWLPADVQSHVAVEDAVFAGIGQYAEIISNGSDAPATVLSECSPHLAAMYRSADAIVAKGQGNYESLSQEDGPLFFLLKAKCPVVAQDLGAQVGDLVLKAAVRAQRARRQAAGWPPA